MLWTFRERIIQSNLGTGFLYTRESYQQLREYNLLVTGCRM